MALLYNYVNRFTNFVTQEQRDTVSASRPNSSPSTSPAIAAPVMPYIRGLLETKGISKTTAHIVEQSWRCGTQKQNRVYLKKWERYCCKRKMDPISSNVTECINFLAELYDDGLSYSSISTARSALSTLMQLQDGEKIGSNTLVSRFMKGVFIQRPALSRYKEIWDVSVVLRYLQKWHPLKELDLKCLTLKTVMLMTLVSSQRCQTINALNISNMHLTENRCTFEIKELLKTTRPNSHFGVVEFVAYPEEPLCVIAFLREYIARTKTLCGSNTKLFISFCKPHNAITTSTIGRWLKDTVWH